MIKSILAKFEAGELAKAEFIQMLYDQVDVLYDLKERISETEIREIRITEEEVLFYHKEGFKLLGLRNEPRCSPHEIIAFREYERFESLLIKSLTSKAEFVVDIGANIGHFTTQILHSNKVVKLIAFEPVEDFSNVLKANLLRNGLEDRCQVEGVALSSDSGIVDFFIPRRNGTNASLKNVSSTEDFRTLKVKKATLDSYAFKDVDFIKIDVEGAELDVLKGAGKLLQDCRPILFMELLRKWSKQFNNHPNQVINFLSGYGYQCYAIKEDTLKRIETIDESTIETNYIFCTEDKLSKIELYVS